MNTCQPLFISSSMAISQQSLISISRARSAQQSHGRIDRGRFVNKPRRWRTRRMKEWCVKKVRSRSPPAYLSSNPGHRSAHTQVYVATPRGGLTHAVTRSNFKNLNLRLFFLCIGIFNQTLHFLGVYFVCRHCGRGRLRVSAWTELESARRLLFCHDEDGLRYG